MIFKQYSSSTSVDENIILSTGKYGREIGAKDNLHCPDQLKMSLVLVTSLRHGIV